MFFNPSRSRSRHPSDLVRDERRHHHPDLTKLLGWKAMQAEADIPGDGMGEGEAPGRCAWA